MSEAPTVGVQEGIVVCPLCWSLCLVRPVEKRRKRATWTWWCGCGWQSEEQECPHGGAALVERHRNWRRLNGWPD